MISLPPPRLTLQFPISKVTGSFCYFQLYSCSVNWESKMANNRSYILYMFAFGLVVPLVVIVVSYVSILRVVKKVTRPAAVGGKNKVCVTLCVGCPVVVYRTEWRQLYFCNCKPYGHGNLLLSGGSRFPFSDSQVGAQKYLKKNKKNKNKKTKNRSHCIILKERI